MSASLRLSPLCGQIFVSYKHFFRHQSLVKLLSRSYAITGNQSADRALYAITGGRIETWLQKYENLVGLTEVREAQNNVIQAERKFQEIQAERRSRQQQVTGIHSKLKDIHIQLDKVQRGDERYLALLTEEYEILREEKRIASELGSFEQMERDHFAALSSAVRRAKKERSRTERTKYWSIIGSIIGATIGIIGTSINSYMRMHELKKLVKDSAAGGVELKGVVGQLSETMQSQYTQIQTFVNDLKSVVNAPSNNDLKLLPLSSSASTGTASNQDEMREILKFVKKHDASLEQEMAELKRILVATSRSSSGDSSIVYVGPEVESLLEKTESSLEWEIRKHALLTSALVYGAFMVTGSILYAFLKHGGGS